MQWSRLVVTQINTHISQQTRIHIQMQEYESIGSLDVHAPGTQSRVGPCSEASYREDATHSSGITHASSRPFVPELQLRPTVDDYGPST